MSSFTDITYKNPNNETLTSKVVDTIVDMLINHEIKPGDKLPAETEWMKILGVGRNTVREAIKMLSSLGIIEIRKGLGSFVSDKVSSNIFNPLLFAMIIEQPLSEHLFELRIMMETSVGELIIDKATDAAIDELVEINNHLSLANDDQQRKICDMEFHKKLFQLAQNPLIEKIGTMVYRLFEGAIEKSVAVNPNIAYSNHLLIIESIKKRDKESMRFSVRKSLEIWKDSIYKN